MKAVYLTQTILKNKRLSVTEHLLPCGVIQKLSLFLNFLQPDVPCMYTMLYDIVKLIAVASACGIHSCL